MLGSARAASQRFEGGSRWPPEINGLQCVTLRLRFAFSPSRGSCNNPWRKRCLRACLTPYGETSRVAISLAAGYLGVCDFAQAMLTVSSTDPALEPAGLDWRYIRVGLVCSPQALPRRGRLCAQKVLEEEDKELFFRETASLLQ